MHETEKHFVLLQGINGKTLIRKRQNNTTSTALKVIPDKM